MLHLRNPKGKEKGRKRIGRNNGKEDSKINDRHRTAETRSSDSVKHGKYQKLTSRNIIFKLRKTKDKEKILKEVKGKYNTLSTEEQR